MLGNCADGAPMIESGASKWSSSIHRHPYRWSAKACGRALLEVAAAKTTQRRPVGIVPFGQTGLRIERRGALVAGHRQK